MNLEKTISLEKIAAESKNLSGAEIKSVVVEAGYFALRENRFKLNKSDFDKSLIKVKKQDNKKHLTFYA